MIFRNSEVVEITEGFGTIVSDSTMKHDDIDENATGAVILLYEYFRKGIHDNGLRDVSVANVFKQYQYGV